MAKHPARRIRRRDARPRPGAALPSCLLACLLLLGLPLVSPLRAQEPVATALTPADPAADLTRKRETTRQELDGLSQTITLSRERAAALEESIADLARSADAMRDALVTSAAKRREIEEKIAAGELRLADLRGREQAVQLSLKARRGLLAEVLAALQRMGRNPPPALLVTPDDALSSVRSAILLGAVVPGIRTETENLAADLAILANVRREIGAERASLAARMTDRLEEERRMTLLIAEKEKLGQENAEALVAERRRAEDLAVQATSLEGLIGTLETEIASVRQAAAAARAAEDERRRMTLAEREAARERAKRDVPDKNRIAPAYAFSDLQGKLAYPAAGDVVSRFGDIDGTEHPLQGIMVATAPGALVTAPADGWVVYSGRFRSYGQMVILNAGDGYHIVLSGMEGVSVRQGQFVVSGEPLAAMGAKRVASAAALALESDRPTLYIEFRKDGKPVDSRPWWTAAHTGKARNDS
ncbi:murein hydrolase activator EnvC family protein [Ensifer soli]|uniref:murein hydrolase activator EnvC family protein n=1 Tax=Ciceribacter sp. sgz301302 TaxID=3342379 RepID=UPI0035B819E8